jgi:hypothetical protein
MLADSNSFLDQVIQILRDLRCKTMSFQNSENLASSLKEAKEFDPVVELSNFRSSAFLR